MLKRLLALALTISSLSFAQDPVFGTSFGNDGEYPNRWFSGVRLNTGPFYHNDLHFFWEGDVFIPAFWSRNSLVFLDLRAIDYQGPSFEGNFGIGLRRLFSDRFIIGGYVFFDRKKTEFRNYFSQITLGAEFRSKKWTACINGYIPIGEACKTLSQNDQVMLGEPDLNGIRNILFINGMEKALYGIDAEVGKRFGDLSIYIGGYYFDRSDVRSVIGPRLRVTYSLIDLFGGKDHYWNDLLLEGAIHHDSPRGTQGYIGFRLFVYFGSTKGRKTTGVHARMLDYVRRDLDIVTLPNDNASFDTLCNLNGEPIKIQVAETPADLTSALANADVIGINGTIPVSSDVILKDGQEVTGGMYYFNNGMQIQIAENGRIVRDNSGTGGIFFVAKNNTFRDLTMVPKATTQQAFGHAIQNDPNTELGVGNLLIDNCRFFANASSGAGGPDGLMLEVGDNSQDTIVTVQNSVFNGMYDPICILAKNASVVRVNSINNNQFLNIVNDGVYIQGQGSEPVIVNEIYKNTFTSVTDSSRGVVLSDLVNAMSLHDNTMNFTSDTSRGFHFLSGSGPMHEINVDTLQDNTVSFSQGQAAGRAVFVESGTTGIVNIGINGKVSNNSFQFFNNTGSIRGFSLVANTPSGVVNVKVNDGGKDLTDANIFFGLTTAQELATSGTVNIDP